MRYALLWLTLLLPVGCASQEKEEPEPVVSIPMELDPTEDYELAAWWSNGEELLYLDEAGSYTLYEGTNRYRPPVEQGKWWQHSYAAMWLEPYAKLQRDRKRVAIRKIEGVRSLNLGELEPMLALDGPPEVVEDHLIGRWSGAFGALWLGADMRYVFSPRTDQARAPAALAGHRGTWRVSGDAVILRPDSPSMTPIELGIQRGDETIVLDSSQGELRQTPAVAEGR